MVTACSQADLVPAADVGSEVTQPPTVAPPSATPTPRPSSTPRPTTAPTQQEVRLSLSLAGTHDSVRSFLDALEKNLRLFDVQILTISEADVAGQVDFQVSIETYYQ